MVRFHLAALATFACIAATGAPATASPTCAELHATTREFGAAMERIANATRDLLDVHITLIGDSTDYMVQTRGFLELGMAPLAEAISAANTPMREAQARYQASCPG